MSDVSVEDINDLSEPNDKDIALIAQCVERYMEIRAPSGRAITVELPEDKQKAEPDRCPTPGSPWFRARCLRLGTSTWGWVVVPSQACYVLGTTTPLIYACRKLTQMMDTPLSPRKQDK